MSTMGTFDAFTAARLGMYAAQFGFQVTGNNISNLNTEGYTRQRLDQVSFKAGAYDMYRSQLDNHVGSGALVMNINQVRDPYLDVRYRDISAKVGYNDTMLAGLQLIANIIDEVGLGEDAASNEIGDGVLHAQIQDLADKLREYANSPTPDNDLLVRNSAAILCQELNSYANALNNLYKETVEDFNTQIKEINECLTNIRDLNREIRDCEIYGDNALELRDERNRQIDTLSQYLHIKVVYSEESIGSGQTVEKLSIYLANDNPENNGTTDTDDSMLIDGIFGAQLSSPEQRVVVNPKYGSTDPADADVKDFLYVKEWEEDTTTNPPTMKVTAGTNFVDDALKVDNDIFAVQISKLVDVKGNEWKGVIRNEEPAQMATYAVQLKMRDGVSWAAGEAFDIGGATYNIVDGPTNLDANEIGVADANNMNALARIVAQVLPDTDDYTISADGDKLVYTAKKPGAVGGDGPAAPPPQPTLNGAALGKFAASFTDDEGNTVDLINGNNMLWVVENPGEDLPANISSDQTDDGSEVRYEYREVNGQWNVVKTLIMHTHDVALDDNDLYGSLQATRELLTEAGEFATTDMVQNIDENASKKRGIPYYQYSLDLLARTFAEQYNKINQGYAVDQNGNYLKENGVDEKGDTIYVPVATVTYYEKKETDGTYTYLGAAPNYVPDPDDPDIQEVTVSLNSSMSDNAKQAFTDSGIDLDNLDDYLKENGIFMGGVLFSNRNDNDDPSNINASNISVSHSWSTNAVQLVPKYEILFGEDGENLDHSTQNTNANHMLNMIEKSLLYDPSVIVPGADSSKLFEGNFNDMFSFINTTLGNDIRATNITLNNNYIQLVQTDASREGVSGVDLNDEAMNLMQFQKAYSAACRLMTVVDEALDRLINNTAI